MISKKSISTLFDKVNIVEVISEFLLLRKSEDRLIGLCPFDSKGLKSLFVMPEKGIFKCFECGRGGNVIDFIIEHEQLNFDEAVKFLADRYGVELEQDDSENLFSEPKEYQFKAKESISTGELIRATEWVQSRFIKDLKESEEGRLIAEPYLKLRGISEKWIDIFGLGYSHSGQDRVTKAAIEDGVSLEALVESGVTIKRDNWIRDRFESRITFPIHNLAGRVIAFGGRTMVENKDKKVNNKYINSPESPIYHKSNILYGISQAREAILELDLCYIVEGYTDVISLHMSGISNVVASAGTSLTIEQIRLIRRFTDTVCLIYDGDAAGVGASMRGVELILKEGMQVDVLPLPEKEDPDSFARKNDIDSLLNYIDTNRVGFIRFISSIQFKESAADPIKRAEAISNIVRLISFIPDDHIQKSHLRECSNMLKIGEESLYKELLRYQKINSDAYIKRVDRERERGAAAQLTSELHLMIEENPFRREEYAILDYLLNYGSKVLDVESGTTIAQYIISELDSDDLKSVEPAVQSILEGYKLYIDNFNFEPIRYFSQNFDKGVNKLCSDILSNRYSQSDFWVNKGGYIEDIEEMLVSIVPRVVAEYKLKRINILSSELKGEIKRLDYNDDDSFKRIIEIQGKIHNLNIIERDLSAILGRVVLK